MRGTLTFYGILALVLLTVQVLTGHFLNSKNVPPAMHTHMGYLTAFVTGLYIVLSLVHIIRKGD